ncbi:exocyst complex component 7-like isoform X1 [Gordionus sp. m RMFG-2023]|uniref:exocyst complex component 7-like isoform X1 n=2 Tax=Gordionus sp. m RMFG-2023 TaxID=3053472 RepID=UPI0031FE214A
MQSLDHVLGYYNTFKESEQIINQTNLDENVEEYLSQMDKIVVAKDFFAENLLSSNELSKINELYNQGCNNLEKEFKYVLTQNSRPIPPHIINDLVNNEEDLTPENVQTITNFPVNVCQDLYKLSSWLSKGSESPNFMGTYSNVRGDNLAQSLRGLRDHVKSQSGSGSSLSTPSSFLSSSYKLSNYTNNSSESFVNFKNFRRKFFRNSSASFKSSNLPPSLNNNANPNANTSSDKDIDIEIYLTAFHALLKLMQLEEKLMGLCLPETLFWQIFGALVQAPLESMLSEGDVIVNAVLTAIKAKDFSPVAICIFPIFKYLLGLKPQLDSVFIYCKQVTKQKFESLMDHMTEVSFELLENYLETIRSNNASGLCLSGSSNINEFEGYTSLNSSSTNYYANLPKDGIVHEITSNTCLFLENISEFMDIIGNILIKKDPITYPLSSISPPRTLLSDSTSHSTRSSLSPSHRSNHNYQSYPRSGSFTPTGDENMSKVNSTFVQLNNVTADTKKAFSVYLSRILSTLGLNLRLKFEAYNEEALGSVFLINNFSYVLKFLRKNAHLLQVVKISTPRVEEYYEQQIQEFKRIYSQCWGKALYYMNEKSGPHINIPKAMTSVTSPDVYSSKGSITANTASFKLKDKDKQAIKDKFTGFNKEFEELANKHKKYFVADPKMRETLRLETKAFILPLYKEFRNKFMNVPFSKNPEKYIKYENERISEEIDQFFTGTD